MAHHNLNRRVDRLEDRAIERAVHAEAERLAAKTGADPDWLIREAERVADLVEQHGRERAVELVAADVGMSAEDLEAGAARLAAP